MKKLLNEVTIHEMQMMREQGMSNKDIARTLEVHPATVYRYLGAQGKRMESLLAFEPTKREDKRPDQIVEEKPIETSPLSFIVDRESLRVGDATVHIDYGSGDVVISTNDSVKVDAKISDLVNLGEIIRAVLVRVAKR